MAVAVGNVRQRESAVKGLHLCVTFRISGITESLASQSDVRDPAGGEFVAVRLLDKIGKGISEGGIEFSPSETGHGRYASCRGSGGELIISMFLACLGIQNEDWELQVSCSRVDESKAFFRRLTAVAPTDQESAIWDNVSAALTSFLNRELGSQDIKWCKDDDVTQSDPKG